MLANAFGTSGVPVEKWETAYDNGWVNISDKAGQNVVLSHGLGMLDQNNESMIVEITGKTVPNGDLLRHLGLQQVQAWNMTYGGGGDHGTTGLVQTSDGG